MRIPFRIKYFLGHLLISLLIAGMSLYLIFNIWYPKPLNIALGIGELTMMMLAIDVILGPLLTLILAKEGKKGLKIDLIFIGIVQIIALLYGLYSIDKGRPVAIAFDINRFELVQKHMIAGDKNQQILQQYQNNQKKNIPVVAVRPAKNQQEYTERVNNELQLGITSSANPTLYQPIAQSFDVIQSQMQPIANLSKFNDKIKTQQVLVKYPQADGFLPIVASANNLTILIDSKNKMVLDVVNLRPW